MNIQTASLVDALEFGTDVLFVLDHNYFSVDFYPPLSDSVESFYHEVGASVSQTALTINIHSD